MESDWNFSGKLIRRLRKAKRVVAFTGAGISAESGVPTFRGQEGLWARYRPEDLARYEAFVADSELVWDWYTYRRKLILETKPNPGHEALVEMERYLGPGAFTLVTQNVDGLHERAGSKNLLELHGNLFRSYCIDCGTDHPELVLTEPGTAPRCDCGLAQRRQARAGDTRGGSAWASPCDPDGPGAQAPQGGAKGLIRPGVVWFGEGLPGDILQSAVQAATEADVFFTIGTSAVVYPAAGLVEQAARAGAHVVEINPEPSALASVADETIQGPAGEVLPALVAIVLEHD